MVFTATGYYYLNSTKNDQKYFKRKSQIDDLSKAFYKIQSKEPKSALVTSSKATPEVISSLDYSQFLDQNNKYHVLLSYKIKHKRKTATNDDSFFSYEDQQLREFEKTHQMTYAKEIEHILKNGSFKNLEEEEQFLLEEYALFEPEEVVNVIETKLMNLIKDQDSLKDEKSKELYFRSILTLYYQKIIEREIDKYERKKLLEMAINSPKLKRILAEVWK